MNLLGAHVILTPHRGEMQTLAESLTPGAASLEESAREIARRSGAVVVLKGHPSLVFVNGSETYACPHGNSGMATAGSGDVLTGLITGLLAQGYSPDEAARLGVWLHATAGDKAADALGEECMLARDITTTVKSNPTYGSYKALETSAFVTVHGIGKPLCYNSNRQF
jgi:NAD(P)H-hydrate epimerase